MILPPLGTSKKVFILTEVESVTQGLLAPGKSYWLTAHTVADEEKIISWALAGTPTAWGGTPLTVVVLLEGGNPVLAEYNAKMLLEAALEP